MQYPIDAVRISETARVHPSAGLASGVVEGYFARVGADSTIGPESSVGAGVCIGAGVVIGANVKIQDNAMIYGPTIIEDGVFIGPGATLTNDRYPRAVTPDNRRKTSGEWSPVAVHVRAGASIGALAVCVAPVEIGCWSLVAAGAVVARSVPDYALVSGAPARWRGWVGRAGEPCDRWAAVPTPAQSLGKRTLTSPEYYVQVRNIRSPSRDGGRRGAM